MVVIPPRSQASFPAERVKQARARNWRRVGLEVPVRLGELKNMGELFLLTPADAPNATRRIWDDALYPAGLGPLDCLEGRGGLGSGRNIPLGHRHCDGPSQTGCLFLAPRVNLDHHHRLSGRARYSVVQCPGRERSQLSSPLHAADRRSRSLRRRVRLLDLLQLRRNEISLPGHQHKHAATARCARLGPPVSQVAGGSSQPPTVTAKALWNKH